MNLAYANHMTVIDFSEVLPPLARAKFRILSGTHDERRDAWGSAGEKINAAQAEISELNSRLRMLFANRATLDHADVIHIKKKIDQHTEELAYLRDLSNLRRSKFSPIGEVMIRLERYIRANVGASFEDVPPVIVKLKKSEVSTALAEVRSKVAARQADLDRVRAAPWPSALVKAKVRAEIVDFSQRGKPDFFDAIERGGPVRWPERLHQPHTVGCDVRRMNELETVGQDVLGLLGWLFKNEMIAAVDAEIDRRCDDKNALAPDVRRTREVELQAAVLEAERVEESTIETLSSDHGIEADRRPDCDPRSVLGIVGPALKNEI